MIINVGNPQKKKEANFLYLLNLIVVEFELKSYQ